MHLSPPFPFVGGPDWELQGRTSPVLRDKAVSEQEVITRRGERLSRHKCVYGAGVMGAGKGILPQVLASVMAEHGNMREPARYHCELQQLERKCRETQGKPGEARGVWQTASYPPKDVHALIPGACEYVIWPDKRGPADGNE